MSLKNFKEKKKPRTPTLLWADFDPEQKKQKLRYSLSVYNFILCCWKIDDVLYLEIKSFTKTKIDLHIYLVVLKYQK